MPNLVPKKGGCSRNSLAFVNYSSVLPSHTSLHLYPDFDSLLTSLAEFHARQKHTELRIPFQFECIGLDFRAAKVNKQFLRKPWLPGAGSLQAQLHFA